MLVSASSQVNNQLLILAKQKTCSYTNTNYGISAESFQTSLITHWFLYPA